METIWCAAAKVESCSATQPLQNSCGSWAQRRASTRRAKPPFRAAHVLQNSIQPSVFWERLLGWDDQTNGDLYFCSTSQSSFWAPQCSLREEQKKTRPRYVESQEEGNKERERELKITHVLVKKHTRLKRQTAHLGSSAQ